MKTYVVGTHWKRLIETLPMSATTKIFIDSHTNYNPLSVAVQQLKTIWKKNAFEGLMPLEVGLAYRNSI